jgi:secondary thiamine-phosphate synthase enzyme
MKTFSKIITLETADKIDFLDVTKQVIKLVKDSMIQNGMVNVYSTHTTTSIRINENEPRLLEDLKCFLEEQVPSCNSYLHDEIDKRKDVPEDEKINAHSHLKSILLGTSETIPLVNGQMILGTWQSIFFVECDGPQKRQMQVTVMGI